jgi:hypothetical protein
MTAYLTARPHLGPRTLHRLEGVRVGIKLHFRRAGLLITLAQGPHARRSAVRTTVSATAQLLRCALSPGRLVTWRGLCVVHSTHPPSGERGRGGPAQCLRLPIADDPNGPFGQRLSAPESQARGVKRALGSMRKPPQRPGQLRVSLPSSSPPCAR